jgi:hypothetical protein
MSSLSTRAGERWPDLVRVKTRTWQVVRRMMGEQASLVAVDRETIWRMASRVVLRGATSTVAG